MKKKMPWVLCAVLAVICAPTIFAYRDLNRAVEKNTITDLQQLNSSLQYTDTYGYSHYSSVTNDITLSSCRLVGGKDALTLSVIYSRFR